MLVADIYSKQFSPISEEYTISEALNLSGVLSLQDIASAIVPIEMRENANLANALYKQNFFQELCLDLKDKKISEVMRKEFITVNLETSVLEIAADFLHNDLYIVPVVENSELIGIVTRSEIKQAIAAAINLS
jgi:signal-transduction protein with cAMP-binding, CBS, and nucleotidyltransferase domain